MDFYYLYARRDGRISRHTFWMGLLGLMASGALVALLVGLAAVGLAMNAGGQFAAMGVMSVAFIGLVALLSYPFYCLAVKRRHDRGSSGLDILVLTVVNLVWGVFALGLMMGPSPEVLLTSPLFTVGHGVGQICSIYTFVVLGLLEGTKGDNTYGPDPLAGIRAATPTT
jgi:uncharacterized membrane protein YhaH (DUF805 family)